MKQYDVVVIGSGSGTIVVDESVNHGRKTALIDRGPIGGTCLNLGCIPSKMLMIPADRIKEIQEARSFGIDADITNVDFKEIMRHMKQAIRPNRQMLHENLSHADGLDLYESEARFIDERTLETDGTKIEGEKIFIAAGARPMTPPINGLEQVEYLTNESLLELREKPDSMIIIGGGYIAAEYGHFFAAMGTDVTIIERGERILNNEDEEIASVLQTELAKRMKISTSTTAIEVKHNSTEYTVITTKTGDHSGEEEFRADTLMIATGRISNAGILRVKAAGIKTDDRGYIVVDEHLTTNRDHIWAFGDIIGKQMFRHAANREALIAWYNSQHDKKIPVDFQVVPHAVFTYPEIAAVGLTETQARKEHDVLIGRACYSDVAMGSALHDPPSLAKAIIDKKKNILLGFHIVGAYASILIHEVIPWVATRQDIAYLDQGLHIHPSLSEIVQRTLSDVHE